MKEAKDAAAIKHHGIVGRIKEILISDIFDPLIPSGFEIGTGKICDSNGNQSGETDLIIYNRGILPPIMHGKREGIFPIEACFYSIEVKSKASASEIKDAINKVKKLLSLDNVSIVPAFFAFDSDLADSGLSELKRYAKYDSNWEQDPILRAICVVGKGYWYYDLKSHVWKEYPATKVYDEVIGLVSGIINTLSSYQTRQTMLGQYLMLENS